MHTLCRRQEANKVKKAAKEMESEVRKLSDESEGLAKRVEHTGDRLKTVEVQFENDQNNINDVSIPRFA